MSEFKPTEVSNDVTRRQWLMILGRVAGIAGFSGVAPELVAMAAMGGQSSTALPPGLYYASEEHLSQALVNPGQMHTIPLGSETEYARPSTVPFQPKFFSDEEFRVVRRIIEILLGAVDAGALSQSAQWLDLYLYSAAHVREAALKLDPLHRALAAAYYGEEPVRELETADPQNSMRSGLQALQQLSIEQYSKPFLALDESQQANLVSAISTARPESPLHKFYEVTRTEAARGYYTSAEGLKELDYKGNWYYRACPGCEQHTPPH